MFASARAVRALVVVSTLAACYQYRADAPDVTPTEATHTYQRKVVWSFFWGLTKGQPKIDNCKSQPIEAVTVEDNYGFALLTVVSLGVVSPKRVQWECAAPRPCDRTLGADSSSTARDTSMVR